MKPYNFSKDRELARDRLRSAVVTAAAELLASGGKDALSARKLTAAVGASTKIIYSHFGGMPGVIAGVYASAFESLAKEMAGADVVNASTADRLAATAKAYRRFAIDNPTLFELMYGSRSRELVPKPTDRLAATASLEVFAQILAAATDDGTDRTSAQAYEFWATIHGPVYLEVSAWLPDDAVFEAVISKATATLAR
jgi:AcrR family transcriptional regulator